MVIELEPGNTCDAVAIPTLITRSHWQPHFPKTEPPVMRLRRGALLRSFPVVSMLCPASNSRNTTLWFPRTGINSSVLTRAHDRTSQKVHTKRCKPLRQDCRH